MGYISLTVLTSLTILLAYSFFVTGAQAKHLNSEEASPQNVIDGLQKQPTQTIFFKTYPVRRMKPLNSFGGYKRNFKPSELDISDDAINEIEKRFDDYGHLRFGKRGGGEGDGFDDYGHMRFGR